MTLLTRAASWLANATELAAGEPVKYRRGAGDCELTAVPGRRLSEDIGADGAAIVSTLHDWIVDPEELVIGGETIKPQTGDIIATASGQTFVVVYSDGENCWRWTDQYRQRIRVHSVERSATGEDE